MKKIAFIVFLFFNASCKGQVKTKLPQAPPIIGGDPVELQASINAGIDPYFTNSHDTVSTHSPNCITRDLLRDRNGNYWLATWKGIIKYDGKVFTNYTLKEGLIQFHVFSCYEDKKGNLWFGTARGGMYRYDGKSFKLFTKKDGLPDNSVSCFAEDKNGSMWFATDSGASCYNGKTFSNYTIQNGLSGNHINSIICDRTGKLWFGGNDGINCYNGESFSVLTNGNGQPIKNVTTLFEDKKGNIWIGSFDGLVRYDGKSFTNFLSNLLTYYIAEDKEGNIWLTHSEPNTHYDNIPMQCLYKYDGKDFIKVIEKYEPQDCQIFGKVADASGNIWFGNMKGVCRYDGKTFTDIGE